MTICCGCVTWPLRCFLPQTLSILLTFVWLSNHLRPVLLDILDTAGQEEFSSMQVSAVCGMRLFVLCVCALCLRAA